jgi:7-cyano-7-deazaguanosine (preQ0) biosynthesis protein QueE
MSTLPIAEVFGPTIQGEGPAAGQNAAFIRFAGCNLSCSWCDTAWTWDGSQHPDYRDAAEVAAQAGALARLVVLTGGEPLLQQRRPGWSELLRTLRRRIHIETNGTRLPDAQTFASAELIVVSPKLDNAGSHRGHQSRRMAEGWAGHANVALKVVCLDADDVDRACELALAMGVPTDRTWVMPEGATAEALVSRWPVIAAAAAERGINATHRLHVLAWGNERGH